MAGVLVRFGRFGRYGNFLTCSQLELTNVNIGLDGLVAEALEHLSDGLPVFSVGSMPWVAMNA